MPRHSCLGVSDRVLPATRDRRPADVPVVDTLNRMVERRNGIRVGASGHGDWNETGSLLSWQLLTDDTYEIGTVGKETSTGWKTIRSGTTAPLDKRITHLFSPM